MKSKLGTAMMITGAMLIAAALSLAVYNIYTDKKAGEDAREALSGLEAAISSNVSAESSGLSEGHLPVPAETAAASDKGSKTVQLGSGSYIGIISVPAIGIELPVMESWSYDNLRIAPCRYMGSIGEDGFVIAGHNYSSHFGSLKNLSKGDEVDFTDVHGRVYRFEVFDIEMISGGMPEKMPSDYPLTMFTCNFDGSERVTVRCVKKQVGE